MSRLITGATEFYAIVGDPIAQVQSPLLFNEAFAARGMDAILVPLHVAPSGLPELLSFFRAAQNFHGLIVTVPHKVAAMELVDMHGPRGDRLGAINAIAKQADGRLIGENFDGAGFLAGLSARFGSFAGQTALIVGAGGAGVAIGEALLSAGLARLYVQDADAARRYWVATRLAGLYPDAEVRSDAPDLGRLDLAVNATPVGMRGETELPVPIEQLAPSAVVADIIMKPADTPLLVRARERGLKTHAGIEMLQGQVESIMEFFAACRETAAGAEKS